MTLPLSLIDRNPCNTCEIIIDVLQEGAEDTFPTLRIAQVAVGIVNACLVLRRMAGLDVSCVLRAFSSVSVHFAGREVRFANLVSLLTTLRFVSALRPQG